MYIENQKREINMLNDYNSTMTPLGYMYQVFLNINDAENISGCNLFKIYSDVFFLKCWLQRMKQVPFLFYHDVLRFIQNYMKLLTLLKLFCYSLYTSFCIHPSNIPTKETARILQISWIWLEKNNYK